MEKEIIKELFEIKECIGEIHGDVKGINKRLDTLNGKVARHEQEIQSHRLTIVKWTSSISAIIGFAGYIINNLIQ